MKSSPSRKDVYRNWGGEGEPSVASRVLVSRSSEDRSWSLNHSINDASGKALLVAGPWID
ncbi:MAG: hypothetical protein EBU26_16815 [Verrucomicrobia bacterium]|nr:hypothetical protein [Verrucomicrobiota bacterium]